jgi:C1A family cysteine protease
MIEHGLGWVRDMPDFRDYVPERLWPREAEPKENDLQLTAALTTAIEPPKTAGEGAFGIPGNVDLSPWCPPIEDQESLGSCTAQAGVGLLEYYERRAFGHHIDASRLFLYKATRNLLNWTGDTGAYLRTTMGAMTLFGVCPENYWPYDIARFDEEPRAFCYAFALRYQSVKYYRLDGPGVSGQALVDRAKVYAAAKLPSMFGFSVYSSIWSAPNGEIPFPSAGDSLVGGHAVVIVGYDDNKQIARAGGGGNSQGAFRIRNSWGTSWGVAGYGWLPYEYVAMGLASDFWSLITAEWLSTGQFGL